MSINKLLSLEDKETFEKDNQSLKQRLKEVELLTHINQFTDEDLFIQHYIKIHKHLPIEDLQNRLEEIERLIHMAKNFN